MQDGGGSHRTIWVKLNTYGASRGNPGEGGCGSNFGNNYSDFLFAFASYLDLVSSIYAEAKVILIGVEHAKNLGF